MFWPMLTAWSPVIEKRGINHRLRTETTNDRVSVLYMGQVLKHDRENDLALLPVRSGSHSVHLD